MPVFKANTELGGSTSATAIATATTNTIDVTVAATTVIVVARLGTAGVLSHR